MTKANPLEIVYRDPKSLIPYARNAKHHSDDQVARIAASIEEFGFNSPILLDGDNGLIAGHGRLLAANQLGMGEVPTIELSHLSDAQKRAYVLADNRLGEVDIEWDADMLAAELDQLKSEGFQIELTGFDISDLLDEKDKAPKPINNKITEDDLKTDHTCPRCNFEF